MQENDFEKELKKKLDAFNANPPVSAWHKIESELNKKERKRKPFIFFMLLGFTVLGFIIFNISHNQIIKPVKTSTGIAMKKPGSTHANMVANADAHQTKKINNTGSFVLHEDSGKQFQTSLIKKINHTNVVLPQPEKLQTTTPFSAKEISMDNKADYNKPVALNDNSIKVTDKNIAKDSLKSITVFNNEDVINDGNSSKKNNALLISNNKDSANKKSTPGKKNSAQTAQNKNDKKPNHASIIFGVTVFSGSSNAVEHLFDGTNKSSYQTNSSTGFDTSALLNKKPYVASNAFAFGIAAQKKIAKKTFLNADLVYTHLSTKSTVGSIGSSFAEPNPITGSSNGYYAGDSVTKKNSYNFIELPVSIQQNFLQVKHMCLAYDLGFSVRQLLSSKSLLYDQSARVYYSNNIGLCKTQFQVLTGLTFQTSIFNKDQLLISPQAAYSFSGFSKSGDARYHFFNYGLSATLLFHKKNIKQH